MPKEPPVQGYIRGRPAWARCPWCREQVGANRPKDASLILHHPSEGGVRDQLRINGCHQWLEWGFHLSHDECEPLDSSGEPTDEMGYWVPLEDLVQTGTPTDDSGLRTFYGWRNHLIRKVWWNPWFDDGLNRAHIHVSFPSGRSPERDKMTPKLRALVMERDGFRCKRCGATSQDARLVVDHIQPVSRGGLTRLENLQTLCVDCNVGKRDRAPHPLELGAPA